MEIVDAAAAMAIHCGAVDSRKIFGERNRLLQTRNLLGLVIPCVVLWPYGIHFGAGAAEVRRRFRSNGIRADGAVATAIYFGGILEFLVPPLWQYLSVLLIC